MRQVVIRVLPRVLLCAAVALSSARCMRGRTAQARADTSTGAAGGTEDFVVPENSQGITISPVRVEPLADDLEMAARIEADPTRVVQVYAPLSGRLVAVRVRPADRVAQGQVLAILESGDVAGARAGYRQAEAEARVKNQILSRSRRLFEHNIIAAKDVEQAQADSEGARATLETARARLSLLTLDTNGTTDELPILAPRAGVVLDLSAAPGQFLKSLDNSSPLCTLVDLSSVWAVGDVYEKDLASIAIGDSTTVSVPAYPGTTWRGRIAALSSAVDSATRTLKLRIELPNPSLRLKAGMFATVRVARNVRAAVVVPATAVLREAGSAFVFLQRQSGHFEHRGVTIGRDLAGGRVEIVAGLTPGDTIIAEGADLVRAAGSPE
jgi:membrane fusion protein, heavy metal efflux system